MLRLMRFGRRAWWVAAVVVVALVVRGAQAGGLGAIDRWQRGLFGAAFPVTNLLVLAGLLAVPILIAATYLSPPADAAAAPGPVVTPGICTLAVLAAGLAGAAALAPMPPGWGPPDGGAARAVDLTRGGAVPAGAVVVSGWRPAAGELRRSDAVFGRGHVARYLPVVAANAPPGTRAGVVIERRDDGLTFDPASLPPQFRGIAARDALPVGAADDLTRRGAIAPGDIAVVFTDPDEPGRQRWQAALVLLLAALGPAALAAMGWWRLRTAAHPRD